MLPNWQRRISPADLIGRHRRKHFVDPRSVAADRFEFRAQLGLVHAARSDDLQILLVAVEVSGNFQPDAIRVEKIEGMNRRGITRSGPAFIVIPLGLSRSNIS